VLFAIAGAALAQRAPVADGYREAKAILRVFAHDAEYDFALGADNEARLIQQHARTGGGYTGPSLARTYRRGGYKWDEWRRDNDEGRRLEESLRQAEKYLHVAVDPESGLVAVSRSREGETDTGDIVVMDSRTLERVMDATLRDGRYVEALAWEPGSQTLLIVERTQRPSFSPLNLLAALAGHPVIYTTLYLARLDVPARKVTEGETPLLQEVKYHPYGWLYVQRAAGTPRQPRDQRDAPKE